MTTAALRRHTDILVAGLAILAFAYVAWGVLAYTWLRGLSVTLLVWECWALVNRFANDTISEAVARLSHQMPLLTLGAGIGIGYGLHAGVFDFLSLCIGGLACHFWFPLHYDAHKIACEAEAGQ